MNTRSHTSLLDTICMEALRQKFAGVSICLVIAAAAMFLSQHYGAPQMLFALLLGIAMHFLMDYDKCVPGINFSSKTILRIGVSLLGFRITVDQIMSLGSDIVFVVLLGVILTISLGALLGRIAGYGSSFGILTGGSVGICGASAAMAISTVIPSHKDHERNTTFIVLTVTALSTVAMVIYPILSVSLDLDKFEAGVFLGGTIHDVAQVVGAGYSISEETGDTATIVKLFRVALLMPIVVGIGLAFTFASSRNENKLSDTKKIIPWFLIAFCMFVLINSYVPGFETLKTTLTDIARWCLVTAISALGIKTSIQSIMKMGFKPFSIIFAETIFICVWVLVGIWWIRP